MNEQYYRKENPKWRKEEKFLTKLWKNKTFKWFVVFGIIALISALFSDRGVLQRIRLEKEKQVWQKKIDSVQAEQNRLKNELKGLINDKEAVEKVAREKYGLIKEGETIYKLKKKE